MANLEELTVDGYIFASNKDAELAKNEIRKIDYIEKHTDMSNLSVAFSLYRKAIEERYFQTPIGHEYLRDIQKALIAAGYSEQEIPAIPLYTTFARIDLKASETVKKRTTKAQKKENEWRLKYRNAVIAAVIFAFMVVAMILISYNGTTVNALNYKRAITNQYSQWEQQLTEREAAVRAKERELNINY